MLSVANESFMLNVLNVTTLSVVMQSVVFLNVVKMKVITLCVEAPAK